MLMFIYLIWKISGDVMRDKITYDDVKKYQDIFALAPAFLLEAMARKNSNLVLKFNSRIKAHLEKLTDYERDLLYVILDSDIGDLQRLMEESYRKSNKKQFKILANPKYKKFVELNINELKKLVDDFVNKN